MWGIASVLWGIPSVLWRVFSTVEGYLQYSGGITSVQWGIASVLWRVASVLWRVFSTLGDNTVHVGDKISTVEGIQYSGGRILISACLVINNDEKISTFFVLRCEIFFRKFFENSSRFHAY